MSVIPTLAECSFGGVPFYYSRSGAGGLPVWPKEAVISVEHIPGGNTDVVQNMGVKATSQLSINIALNPSAYTSFLAMIGNQASCTIVGNAPRQAILMGVKGEKIFQAGYWRLQADFLGL